MVRKIFIFISVLVCTILQCSIFPMITTISITPNLLIAFLSVYSLMKGKKSGLFTGLFCGIIMDILWGRIMGFYALFYMLIGFVNGCFNKQFFPDDVKLPLGAAAVSDFAYGLIIYFFFFLLRGRFDFGYYLIHVIIPEVVYTTLITFILFPIVLRINQRIEKREKRSAIKFG